MLPFLAERYTISTSCNYGLLFFKIIILINIISIEEKNDNVFNYSFIVDSDVACDVLSSSIKSP